MVAELTVRIKAAKRLSIQTTYLSVFIDGSNDEFNLCSFTFFDAWILRTGGFILQLLYLIINLCLFLILKSTRTSADLGSLLKVSRGGKFVHILVAQLQRSWFLLMFRRWPTWTTEIASMLFCLFVSSWFTGWTLILIILKKKKRNCRWKKWSCMFHFYYLFFLEILCRRYDTVYKV